MYTCKRDATVQHGNKEYHHVESGKGYFTRWIKKKRKEKKEKKKENKLCTFWSASVHEEGIF